MNTAPLIITVGLFFLLMGIVGAALLRTSSTPLVSKMTIMGLLVAIPCTLVWALPSAYGYPVETTLAALPDRVELLGFLPYDNETHVYLWLSEGGAPRAYSVAMPDEFKETLREAREQLAKNGHAELVKRKGGDEGKPGSGAKDKQGKTGTGNAPKYIGIDGGEAPYELAPNAFTLPAKGG